VSKKRYIRKPIEIPEDPNKLPTDRPIAVYYRQSTAEQVDNISTDVQKIDLPAEIEKRGWPRELIRLVDEDEGVSGAKRINERAGMSRIYDWIITGEIGAVAVYAEDRLFRDETLIQSNLYVEACEQAKVITVTPRFTYNFHGRDGSWHKRQFRFKAEMAAEYITSHIKGYLIPMKEKKARQGYWVGGPVTVGYILDPDNRFVPFLPAVEIVLTWFTLFVEHFKGNLGKTTRYIQANGPFYPDFDSPAIAEQIPEGHRAVPSPLLKFRNNGVAPSRPGLTHILTHAVYIGHWMRDGQIVKYNNHAAIIPEPLFMKAFNYLSPVNFDGSENKNYAPNTRRELWEHYEHTGPRPLYEGLIYGLDNQGVERRATAQWMPESKQYGYQLREYKTDTVVWRKIAQAVDEAITDLLREELQGGVAERVLDEAERRADKSREEAQAIRKRHRSQLAVIQKEMQQIERTIVRLTSPTLIAKKEKRYTDLENAEKQLNKDLLDLDTLPARVSELSKFREDLYNVGERWDELPENVKRAAIELCIERIDVGKTDEHELRITVSWRDASTLDPSMDFLDSSHLATPGGVFFDESLGKLVGMATTIVIPHTRGNIPMWKPSHVDSLLAMVKNGATQIEIAQQFPTRKWKDIASKYKMLTGVWLKTDPKPIHSHYTYYDYQQRIQATEGDNEVCRLDKSVSASSSQDICLF
jgi:hypothetical protein